MNRSYLVTATAVAVIVVLFSVVIFHKSQNKTKPVNNFATLVSETPGVFINNIPAKQGSRIHPRDIVESDGENYRLKISDAVVLDVQNKSRLWYFEKDGIIRVELIEGAVAFVADSTKKPNRMVFSTPTGDIETDGAVFYARVLSPDETYVCICHGQINIKTKNETKTVPADHHGGYTIRKVGQSEKILPGEVKYHDDRLLEEMAAGINYKIEFRQ